MSDPNPGSTASAKPTSWRRRLLICLACFGVLIVALLILIAVQPDDFKLARSTVVNAAPDKVFAHVDDFHRWEAWSPWAKLDPQCKNTFAGPESGKGAIFKWSGNNEVGEGSMTIVDSKPSERIQIRLDFVRPFEDTSDVEFTFQPAGQSTKVTWTMSGKNNFISKAFCLLMNMEKMLGGQFDQGLASMKAAVEKGE